jgi:hypothetical protein
MTPLGRKGHESLTDELAAFFKIQLGTSKFTDLDPPPDEEFTGPHFKAMLGARVARYSEFDYFGNPGHHLTYVFTASNSTWAPGRWELLHQVIGETGYREWPYPMRPDLDDLGPSPSSETEPEWEDLRAAQCFRADTVISTFTAIHPDLWADNFPVTFGPHGDEVRLVP